MSYRAERTESSTPLSEIKLSDLLEVDSTTPPYSAVLNYSGSSFGFNSLNTDEAGINFSSKSNYSLGVGGGVNVYNTTTRPFLTWFYGANTLRNIHSDTGFVHYPAISGSGFGYYQGVYVPSGTYIAKAIMTMKSNSSTAKYVWRRCIGPSSGTAPSTSNTAFTGPHFYHAPRSGRFLNTASCVLTTTNAPSFIGLRCVASSSCSLSSPSTQSIYYQMHLEKIG